MSAEEIITTTTIIYDVRGVDRSIRTSQSLLFTVNALRLGVADYKRLTEDPSFSNFLWTGIQLTRIWTNLLRLVKRTNQAQRFGLLQGAIGGRGGVARGAAAARGQISLAGALAGGQLGFRDTVATQGLWAAIMGFAAANPVVIAALVGGVVTAGIVGNEVRQRRMLRDWKQRQREIAKSQGLEN